MPTEGIEVTLKELVDLRCKAIHPLREKHKCPKLSGQIQTSLRGRGIEFASTREYQAGDDMRHMAWRVTARSLKPHIKVYHEEKERPVWLAIDLSPSVYFGTRCRFKSVAMIKQAAFLGWSHLLKHDRIGAIIARDPMVQVYKPRSSESYFLTILYALAKNSSFRPVFNENHYLHETLKALQQHVHSGSLIIILSDFFDFNTEIQKRIKHLAERAHVKLIFTYDPFEAEASMPYSSILTNGYKQASFNMDDPKNREHYQQQFQIKHDNLIHFSEKNCIPLQILRTDQKE